jgi:putative transposase
MTCSMSRRGDCWDNAVVESFNATIKTELIHRTKWKTREEVRAAVCKYIETWYNLVRLHSTLGYRSPIEFEQSEPNGQTELQQAS